MSAEPKSRTNSWLESSAMSECHLVGRLAFTRPEIAGIRAILQQLRSADRTRQKSLRSRLRREFDFYITDFATDRTGFTASDLDEMIAREVISVRESAPRPPAPG